MKITEDLLRSIVDINGAEARVRKTLEFATQSEEHLLIFMKDYAHWNRNFAAGVTQLVANIASANNVFVDSTLPYALADRSAYIASFIFDAARDEYDDHINRQRDPHRSMAQAMLYTIAEKCGKRFILNQQEPEWLRLLSDLTVSNYSGVSYDDQVQKIFYGIGYHLGSEMLADQEFSIIDATLREKMPETVDYLLHHTADMADSTHRAYAWIGVHSGHGGGAEADHFQWALDGVNRGFDFLHPDLHETALNSLRSGYERFGIEHSIFFTLSSEIE